MSKGRINNNYYLRYGLVVLITLAFVVATYFIVNPKTPCEAQGKVNDPTPGSNRCLEPCKQDPKGFRCLTDKCKARYDINKGAVVCSDCEIGKIPLKDEGKNTYNCVPECNNNENSNWVCSDGEKCKYLSEGDTGSPSYCASNLYTCVKDVGDRGFYCKPVTPGSGGMPLNECLKKGKTGENPCSCNHTQGYALNSENTACSTTACTLDGLNGWGSNQAPLRNDPTSTKKNNSNKSSYVDPIVDESKGRCYAMSENGLLLDPQFDNSTCSDKTKAEDCHDTNSDGWKCKWLPGVKCTRRKYNDAKCLCESGCVRAYPEGGIALQNPYIDACNPTKAQKPPPCQPDCKGFQYECTSASSYRDRDAPARCVQYEPDDVTVTSVRDVYSIPPTNCLTKKGFVPPSDNLIRYGDDIILSIDNKQFNESRLLFSCGRCSDYDGSKNNTDLMTFVGKYGGESSPVSTETITFKIVPTFSSKDNQNQKKKLMGNVLNTNDAFHLRAKYGDSNTKQSSYYYFTEAKCTPGIYGIYNKANSTFKKTEAQGYTSLSPASSGTDQTVLTTTFRFVDPDEDAKCTSTGPACNQDSKQVISKKAYRLKFSKSSPNPYYVGLGDDSNINQPDGRRSSPKICKANFLVTFGPISNTKWFIMKPQSILQAQCPYSFKNDGSAKTNEQIGGYNPSTPGKKLPNPFYGLRGTKRLHPFPDNNDLSLYALILALLIVAILVFTVRQR